LVDLQELEIRALRANGIPIEIQKAAFEEAMNRVVRSTVVGVAEVSAESWRAPAQKSSKALVVYQALPAQTSSKNLQPEPGGPKALSPGRIPRAEMRPPPERPVRRARYRKLPQTSVGSAIFRKGFQIARPSTGKDCRT